MRSQKEVLLPTQVEDLVFFWDEMISQNLGLVQMTVLNDTTHMYPQDTGKPQGLTAQ